MPAETPRREGVGLIAVMIAAVTIMFLFFVGTIYYRSWLHRQDSKGVLVVEGGPEYEGVNVRVTSLALVNFDGVLSASDNYTVRIGLDPGVYSMRIFRGDETLFQRAAFDIRELQSVKLTLKPSAGATRPAAR